MDQLIVKRLASGRKIVQLKVEDMPFVQAWFEPSLHRRGLIDFKVNGVTVQTSGQESNAELDSLAAKLIHLWKEKEKQENVLYISSYIRESLLKRARAVVEKKVPQYINRHQQFEGDYEGFVEKISA